jgi:hypothetical protein
MKPQIRLQSLIAVAAARKASTAIVLAEKEKEKVTVDCVQQPTESIISMMLGTGILWLMGAIVTELMGLGQVVNLLWAVSVCLILLYYSNWYCRI